MKSTGVARRVDNLGRIIVPITHREVISMKDPALRPKTLTDEDFRNHAYKPHAQNHPLGDHEISDLTQIILDIQTINETIRIMKGGFENA